MKKIVNFVASKFIQNYKLIRDPYVRAEYGILEGWISTATNILLFLIKLILGLTLKSMSLIADSVHTLSDCITSFIVIIAFKISRKPSDKEHPFGHGQIEPIATLIVAVILMDVGIKIGWESFYKIKNPVTSTASWVIIGIVFLTILVKEFLARFSYELGAAIDSNTLKADAMHHRSDAISTLLVVIALICSHFGILWVDGLMGLVVACIICYYSFKIGKGAVNPLLGEAPSEETLKEIERMALTFDRVLGVHDIIFHKYGYTKIISFHLEVSDKIHLNETHELCENVEEELSSKLDALVVVHIDPINKDHPKYDEIVDFIDEAIAHDSRIKNFHELRIIGSSLEKCSVVFDVALNEDVPNKDKFKVVKDIHLLFKKRYPHMKVYIKVEQRFVFNPKKTLN